MARLKFDPDMTHTFDLECTTQEPTQCWLGASTPLNDATLEGTHLFRSIFEVVNYIFQRKHDNHRFYAHNLSYDMSFILAHLREFYPDEFQIHNLINPPMGGMMSITIELRSVKIHFYDTVIKFACPLAKVLETYTDFEKGDTPIYKTVADVQHNDYNDRYCKIDACGLAQALPYAMESGTALTVPSDAFTKWKEFMNEKHGNVSWRYKPIAAEIDIEMRKAYRGGFTFVHPLKKEVVLHNVKRYDVNSMYPAQMRLRTLPYGKPLAVKKGAVKASGVWQLGIQKFTIQLAEVKDGCCPFVATSKGFRGTNEYADTIQAADGEDFVELALTLQEFELFKQHYHITGMKLFGGWLFKGSKADFVQYIDEFWELKCSSNPTEKNRGKLFLNSLYGKFAESPIKQEMEIDFSESIIRIRPTGETTCKPVGYLPLGIFITSYARIQLIEAIQVLGYENFVYCDTDSIHVLETDNVQHLDQDSERIGAWDFEGTFVTAKYLRAKRYMGIDDNGCIKVVCAGINKRDLANQVTRLDDFYIGREINTMKFKNGVNGKQVKPQITKI